jgi:hypothetical protein
MRPSAALTGDWSGARSSAADSVATARSVLPAWPAPGRCDLALGSVAVERGQRLQLFDLLGDAPVGSKHVRQFLARRQERRRPFDRLFERCHSFA